MRCPLGGRQGGKGDNKQGGVVGKGRRVSKQCRILGGGGGVNNIVLGSQTISRSSDDLDRDAVRLCERRQRGAVVAHQRVDGRLERGAAGAGRRRRRRDDGRAEGDLEVGATRGG